jgi:polyisoprenoid-binding protein YceI
MSAIDAAARTAVPSGTWHTDAVHSTLEFAVKHMIVSTFRGAVPAFEATLTSGEDGVAQLAGTADVASIVTQDENLTGHLQAPDFFDAARYPQLRFASRSIVRDGDAITVEGDLTVKGITRPVELTGEISGPAEDPWGGERVGLELTSTVDRREFDLEWNAPVPGGGFVLGNDVKLTARLELVRS